MQNRQEPTGGMVWVVVSAPITRRYTMPVHSHHTASSEQQQSHLSKLDDWTSEVLPRLPSDFDQQARKLHAFQRSRAFDCPADLLRGLLLYVLSPFGFRYLGVWGVL